MRRSTDVAAVADRGAGLAEAGYNKAAHRGAVASRSASKLADPRSVASLQLFSNASGLRSLADFRQLRFVVAAVADRGAGLAEAGYNLRRAGWSRQ